MKYKGLFRLLAFMLVVICLVGCSQEATPLGSIDVAEVNFDTATNTSMGQMAETESGYYYISPASLVYADKSDLQNWVAVCSDPSCNKHKSPTCPADVRSIYIDGDRIFTMRDAYRWNDPNADDFAIFSMALDGTDLKEEIIVAHTDMVGGGHFKRLCTAGAYYTAISTMETDGKYYNNLAVTDDRGTRIIIENYTDEMYIPWDFKSSNMQGDVVFFPDAVFASETSPDSMFRITDDGIEEIPGVQKFDTIGAFIQGNEMYRFEKNKGYYLTDLTTGQSQKWMEPQLQDSRAWHLTNQWIVETNADYFQPPEVPELKIYNGSDWKTVALPPDVLNQPETSFVPQALTTEHIFFTVDDHTLYYVDLTEETYTFTLAKDFHLTEPISWAAENS